MNKGVMELYFPHCNKKEKKRHDPKTNEKVSE